MSSIYNFSNEVKKYLINLFDDCTDFKEANLAIYEKFRIHSFFLSSADFEELRNIVSSNSTNYYHSRNKEEYGDFQTNLDLAIRVLSLISSKDISPDIVLEPTSGYGNFILATLSRLRNVKTIIGIEIYKPYYWQSKLNIINHYLSNNTEAKPDIYLFNANIFDFNFSSLSELIENKNVLILGNPPWVTNSKLSSLNSDNLPVKTNFKGNSGIEAITGKGNFDIAENIISTLMNYFRNTDSYFAILTKNSVIKNIIFEQNKLKQNISDIESYSINSKKEFNVAVEASLLCFKTNSNPSFQCSEFDIYTNEKTNTYGWHNGKFVSSIDNYFTSSIVDGECQYTWRQGIKHDCSSVMELERTEPYYINKLNEKVILEDGLIYGLLKSSDLKSLIIKNVQKYTIITQKKVGDDTSYIKKRYPNIYSYLSKHIKLFQDRKSIIYSGKPPFSIFGIGEYAFAPYKVAISSMYKTYSFSLILPFDSKPQMLDDTCYYLSFNNIEFAIYTLLLLNSELCKSFLKSITFIDAKRVFTKDILMRIDLAKLASILGYQYIEEQISIFDKNYNAAHFDKYLSELISAPNKQLSIF